MTLRLVSGYISMECDQINGSVYQVGLGLLVYDWPQPCVAIITECPDSYLFVVIRILIIIGSAGLMTC